MNLSSPIASPAPEAAPTRAHRLIEEIAHLLQSCPAATEFYADFLQRVLAAVHGVAGAMWSCTPQGQFHLQYQCNLAEIGLDKIANARPCHHELLRSASQRQEPLWAPPRSGPDSTGGQVAAANLSGYGLLLAPVAVDGEVTGIIEVWMDFYHDAQSWRPAARLLAEVAGFAAAYQHRTRLRHLQEQQRLWEQLEAFVRRLHGSLDARQVAYLATNEARQLLGCDQVAAALRYGEKVRVEAVSGATQVDRTSALVRAMEELCEAVLATGQALVFAGARDDSIPPAVQAALKVYLKESSAQLLMVVPLPDERGPAPELCRSALVIENFAGSQTLEQLRDRMAVVVPHVASALYNAVEHSSMPLGWLSRNVGRTQAWLSARRWTRIALPVAAALVVALGLLLIPAPLRREATGQLVPVERQIVFATVSGRVVELKVQSGDQVEKGQELLFMEDLEAQLKIEQLAIKISSAEHRLVVLNEQMGRPGADDDRDALVKERISQEYELRKALAERSLLLHGSRSPQKMPVTAPLSGKIVTFDAREQLVGKTVKPGDPLLRVARVQGPWEIELFLPEASVGQVREGLSHSADGSVEVDVLLLSRPDHIYKAVLKRGGLGGETVVRNGTIVVPARAQITDAELLNQLATMPVGVELRARVNCGNRALGYVLFGDLLEFVYEHVWF